MKDGAPNTRSDAIIVGWILKEARPYWAILALSFALDLLATPLALLTPVPLMLVIDGVIGSRPLPDWARWIAPGSVVDSARALLVMAVILVVVIALLSHVRKYGSWLFKTYLGERLVLQFRAKLLTHSQRLSAAYHDRKGTADAIYRIQYDATAIQDIVIHGIAPFVSALLTLLAMLYITARLDWRLALVAVGISPVFLVLATTFRGRLRRQWREVKEAESSVLSAIQEGLGALQVVQAFGQEEREHARFVLRAEQGLAARVRALLSESAFGVSIGITIALGTATVLYLGVQRVVSGTLTVGELLLVMSYLAQLYGPLETVGQQGAKWQKGLTSAERAFELLRDEPLIREMQNAVPIDRATGTIEFEHVTFSYEPGVPILQNASFSVSPGMRVGIVGRTGVGKTTLISLLMRLYDPDSGRVTLDGRDLREYRLADLRDQFAIVLQDSVLFFASVAENIAYAKPNATVDQIMEAARAAHADEFIRGLPDGYNTEVGERGMLLSGGQRQRIALARAFLKDAPILILDEPTSAVDVNTEVAIMDALGHLMKARTTFIIAHRRSALKHCDLTFTLDEGRLIAGAIYGEAALVEG